jgi:hypothetical protein
VGISCPSGRFQKNSRVRDFNAVILCITLAKYLKRSLANSWGEICLRDPFESLSSTFKLSSSDEAVAVNDQTNTLIR